MGTWLTPDFASIVVAGFVVGIVVGLTGMGGGALMTPALIFLGVGNASAVVTADLTAAAISRSAGAVTHARQGSPNMTLAKWLIIGSVPAALVGPWIIHGVAGGDPESVDQLLLECIGFALLFAATTYALRLYLNLRRKRDPGRRVDPDPPIRPLITVAVGALGGLLVGITSVGAGSVIMIALLMLYPGLSARAPRRHGPRAGRAARAGRRSVEHRDQRPGLAHPRPAGTRVDPGHRARRADRPAGAAVLSSAAAS